MIDYYSIYLRERRKMNYFQLSIIDLFIIYNEVKKWQMQKRKNQVKKN